MKNAGAILVLFIAFYLIGEFGLFGIIIVATAAFIGWYTTAQPKKHKRRSKPYKAQTPQEDVAPTAPKARSSVEVGTADDIERAWARGDYEKARRWLQKIAYSMVNKGVTDRQRQEFKQLVKEFAVQDPLYYELLSIIRPAVNHQPGVLQSQLTKDIDGYSTEHIRYVLYYAHELGDIHRVKHGRTYKLYLPGETLEGEVAG